LLAPDHSRLHRFEIVSIREHVVPAIISQQLAPVYQGT